MGTKNFSNANDLITFSRSSAGTALRKIAYGPELVTNGDFSNGTTGWQASLSGSISETSGQLTLSTNNGVWSGASTAITIQAGKLYRATFDIISSDGTLYLYTDDVAGSASKIQGLGGYTGTGTKSVSFVASSSAAFITFTNVNVATDNTWVIDNVSVKEVLFDHPDGTLTLFNHPADVPRIEYDADGNVLGLLVEESRTNLVTSSEDFTDASWTKSEVSVSSDTTSTPSGETASLIIPSTSALSHFFYDSISLSAQAYTQSVYAKAGGYNYIAVQSFGDGILKSCYFDLLNGTAGTPSNCTASIQNVENGWYRCAITFTPGAASHTVQFNPSTDGSTINKAGDGTSGIYVYGAQLEAGAFPTSYIPTYGATATRSADVASIPVADFGYNQSEGSVVVEFESKINSDLNYVWDLSFDSSNRMFSKASITQNLRVIVGGANQANITAVPDAGQFNKYAYAIKRDDMGLSKNGEAPTIDASGSIVENPTTLQIGAAINGTAGYLDGHIKSIKYYPRRLSNAQLQELTT